MYKHLLFTLSVLLSSQVKANAVLCPKILTAAGYAEKLPGLDLGLLYQNLGQDGRWFSGLEDDLSTYTIEPSRSTVVKIKIEEQDQDNGPVKNLYSLNCPLPIDWQLTSIPKAQILFPTAFQNANEKTAVSFTKRVNGVVFSGLVGVNETLDVGVLWKMFPAPAADPSSIQIPAYVPRERLSYRRVELPATEAYPVKGVRISESKNFSNYWHLLLASDQDFLAERKLQFISVADPSSEYLKLNTLQASKATQTLSLLSYWDAAKKSQVNCKATPSADPRESCFALNYRLYKPVLDAIDLGKSFYVQLLSQLNEGYLLSTYEVASQEIRLVDQMRVMQLSRLNLPDDEL